MSSHLRMLAVEVRRIQPLPVLEIIGIIKEKHMIFFPNMIKYLLNCIYKEVLSKKRNLNKGCNPLFFNFNCLFDCIFCICCLVGYFFAYFELFQDTGFDGYFCDTFGIGFGFVCFAVEFECHCFLF